jgi:ketosteroid isomerase-like protein
MNQDQYLKDFLEISKVKARYCRFLDTKDWDAYTDLFTEDLVLDDDPASGRVTRGRAEAIKRIRSFVEHAQTGHHVHSPEMDIRGDEADVIWAMQDRVIGPAQLNERAHTGFGHYHERYVRQDGRWRIASLKLRYVIFEAEPLT